jgi:superfamily I DNA/RNA helicase
MYNKVLARFTTERGNVAAQVVSSTFHKWVHDWWRSATGVTYAPTIPGSKYDHDWPRIQAEIIGELADGKDPNKACWGHIIIDEGQDFPQEMYASLKALMTVATAKGAKPAPAITVLADDNQRLNAARNSTVEGIRKALGLHEGDQNVFKLRTNYRNSLPIARFAKNFYVGLASGVPDLPVSRRGPLPVLSLSDKDSEGKNLNAFTEKIARYVKAHRTEEVGVIVPRDKVRGSLVNRLQARLKGDKVVVQTYSSKDGTTSAKDLTFDRPGHVTVLNYQSAKGLEFDAVFVVDPGYLINGGSSPLQAKMALYVMSSRARSFLNVMLVQDQAAVTIQAWLPDSSQYELEQL